MMRIAILSDAGGPTAPDYPGHGLGHAVSAIAAGLQARGHDVTLYAAEASRFDGHLVIATRVGGYENERQIARQAYHDHRAQRYDVLFDHGHTHVLSALFPELPMANMYHDIWQPPSRCAIILTEGQRALMPDWAANAVRIPHAVDAEEFPFNAEAIQPEYAFYLGIIRDYKQPLLAIEACARAGIRLIMAGPIPPGAEVVFSGNTNVSMAGPVNGKYRVALLQEALCLLQLGTHEAFGLTTIEAGLCGTPVVGWPAGGTVDLIEYGVNGVFVPGGKDKVQAVADAIDRARSVPREMCRAFAERYTDKGSWLHKVEQTLERVARGERW